jgi:hypothetical protein
LARCAVANRCRLWTAATDYFETLKWRKAKRVKA